MLVFKAVAILEKAGKYISIEKGPKAVKEPKIKISTRFLFFGEFKGPSIFCRDGLHSGFSGLDQLL